MVLGRAAHQRRTADIDILDRVGIADIGPSDGLRKRIEIHNHEIDRLNAMFGQHGDILGMIAAEQNAAVDSGMERLHATIHHLGKAGVFGHIANGEAILLQELAGPAGAEQLDARGL